VKKNLLPEDVSAVLLNFIKTTAEKQQGFFKTLFGFKFQTATITVPVLFHGGQRKATEDAGKKAGFKMVRVVEEPVAAAIAYGLDAKGSQNVLVFDFGGGTLDVALLRLSPETRGFLVKATAGDPHLGGEDFDRRIVTLILDSAKSTHPAIFARYSSHEQSSQVMQILWRHAEKAKRMFQTEGVTSLPIDLTFPLGEKISIVLERTAVDEATKDLMNRIVLPIKEVLEEADVSVREVEDIVLVGGSSRLRLVREKLREMFAGTTIHTDIDPDLAIAIGAARSYGCGQRA
jgi:molecular chaperone DnaK (HSP70)